MTQNETDNTHHGIVFFHGYIHDTCASLFVFCGGGERGGLWIRYVLAWEFAATSSDATRATKGAIIVLAAVLENQH